MRRAAAPFQASAIPNSCGAVASATCKRRGETDERGGERAGESRSRWRRSPPARAAPRSGKARSAPRFLVGGWMRGKGRDVNRAARIGRVQRRSAQRLLNRNAFCPTNPGRELIPRRGLAQSAPGECDVTSKALVIALALLASPAVAACNELGTGTKDTPIFSPPLGARRHRYRAPTIPFGAKRALRDGRCVCHPQGSSGRLC